MTIAETSLIVWLNGPFGVGKTTTAELVTERSGWRLFDPEHVGYLLAGNLQDLGHDDFQDLVEDYWRELATNLEAVGLHTRSGPTTWRERPRAGGWTTSSRSRRLGDGFRPPLTSIADLVVDRVGDAVGRRAS